jgi:hypothetical protein
MASSTAGYPGYYPTQSQPIAMPQKQQTPYYAPYQYPNPYSRISTSPPEASESVTTGGPSYDPSGTGSSYAASASDYDSASTGASIDLLDYMSDRMNKSFDPLPLDRSLAQQAQT